MTYSIVARDQESGEVGVAVQSHYFSVGSVVPWVEAGVGAVATQSLAEVSYGPLGLDLLRGGKGPAAVLGALTAADEGSATRQVAVVSAAGEVAAHTGERCIAEASHITGDGWSVQANMMRDAGVPEAMAAAFTASEGTLARRMLAALQAAEAAGGDIRGRQSACLVVAPAGGPRWARVVELRVEDDAQPLSELGRLLSLAEAYRSGAPGPALGDNPELAFWRGVALAAAGALDQARPFLEQAFSAGDGWVELLRRLPAAGLFPDDRDLLEAAVGVHRDSP